MLVVDGATVRDVFPMREAIRLMRGAFAAFDAGDVHQPVRTVVQPPSLGGVAVLMPALVGGEAGGFGLKVVTAFAGNAQRGVDVVQGFVALLDQETGGLRALVDAASVTEIRTSAVSGLATDLLARPDAGDLAVLGAGVQARGHLQAMAEVRTLRRVRIWNRTRSRAEALASSCGLDAEVCDDAETAVRGADIVCTTTASDTPVLLGEWLAPGTHVNAVGAYRPDARELDTAAIATATVVVDSREAVMAEAGDVLVPMHEGAVGEGVVAAELGEVVSGRHPGRTGDAEITVFKSLGLAMQDVVSAAYIVAAATAAGTGVTVAV